MDFMDRQEQVDAIIGFNNYTNFLTDQFTNLVTDATNYFVDITVPEHLAEKLTAAGATVSFVN